MPKRQIPFLSSVLRGDIQNYCKFELQSPDNMTIVNKLLYIDSYYLASMVIFSNVLKQLFGKKLFQNNFSPQIINYIYISILSFYFRADDDVHRNIESFS